MNNGFGQALLRRAADMARTGAERAAEAMVAAAEAELPSGVSVERDGTSVVLAGSRLRARYWGGMRRVADTGLRLLVGRMTARRRA